MLLPLHGRSLLVAVATILLLLQLVSAEHPNQYEDKPIVNFNALFTAYIRMGDALFGTWAPEDFADKLQRIRDEED